MTIRAHLATLTILAAIAFAILGWTTWEIFTLVMVVSIGWDSYS